MFRCDSDNDYFPAPAVNVPATIDTSEHKPTSSSTNAYSSENNSGRQQFKTMQPKPGSLPSCANELSNAARALLLRLLDTDPKVRLRNLRQLQQTAFYMRFNFEHIKAKKISPRCVLETLPKNTPGSSQNGVARSFTEFDQPMSI